MSSVHLPFKKKKKKCLPWELKDIEQLLFQKQLSENVVFMKH